MGFGIYLFRSVEMLIQSRNEKHLRFHWRSHSASWLTVKQTQVHHSFFSLHLVSASSIYLPLQQSSLSVLFPPSLTNKYNHHHHDRCHQLLNDVNTLSDIQISVNKNAKMKWACQNHWPESVKSPVVYIKWMRQLLSTAAISFPRLLGCLPRNITRCLRCILWFESYFSVSLCLHEWCGTGSAVICQFKFSYIFINHPFLILSGFCCFSLSV